MTCHMPFCKGACAWLVLSTLAWMPAGAPTARAGDTIDMTGSIALANLMTTWAQAYNRQAPELPVSIAAPGSAAGVQSLLAGTADVVLLGAPLTAGERRRFMARYGKAPVAIAVAMDGIAVFVHRSNPLRHATLPELDAVYSRTRACGARQPIRTWGELAGEHSGRLGPLPIAIAGLGSPTGAYRLFRHVALCDGDFRDDFQGLTGPADVAALIRGDDTAMGFAGSALRSPDLRPLAIASGPGAPRYLPTVAAIQSRRYPLSRFLEVIVLPGPDGGAAGRLRPFLDFLRSPAGQETARAAGYVPLPVPGP